MQLGVSLEVKVNLCSLSCYVFLPHRVFMCRGRPSCEVCLLQADSQNQKTLLRVMVLAIASSTPDSQITLSQSSEFLLICYSRKKLHLQHRQHLPLLLPGTLKDVVFLLMKEWRSVVQGTSTSTYPGVQKVRVLELLTGSSS